MNLINSAQAYRRNSILSATPGQLTLMLFDGALRFMNTAIAGFDETNVARRNEMIHNNLVKTQAILNELQCSLDHTQGGDFPGRMSALYSFMRTQLQQANLRKDKAPINVVIELLGSIRDSWAQMLMKGARSGVDTAAAMAPAA
jgi:flagellar protein FliS